MAWPDKLGTDTKAVDGIICGRIISEKREESREEASAGRRGTERRNLSRETKLSCKNGDSQKFLFRV